MTPYDRWQSPLCTRYTSIPMQEAFGDARKFQTWRKLWLELARAEQTVGIPEVTITPSQILEMASHLDLTPEEFALALKIEKDIRHDVVAHVRTFGQTCPLAKPIIHLGATSAFVTDNADVIIMRDALGLVATNLAKSLDRLRTFARQWRDLPTLAWTHFQAAQPVTVGRRACLWAQELLMDLKEVERVRDNLLLLGVKGATGTQDSFLDLCDGDHAKVKEIDRLVTQAFGFSASFPITGQTYSRKQDLAVLHALVGIAVSAAKMSNDWRLLQHLKEVEEPFEEEQVGSSAMAYKRNPMRSERIKALVRYVLSIFSAALHTPADQWFERTLDDSACRRFTIPETFLCIDAILKLVQNVAEGLVVYPQVITRHLMAELPFMATERIINAMVREGADRQLCHEGLRVHAQAAGKRVKSGDGENDFITRILEDRSFWPIHDQLGDILDPKRFIGRSREQVDEFIADELNPMLEPYAAELGGTSELKV